MKKIVLSLMLSLGCVGVVYAAGDAGAGQAKVAMCSGCHGVDGNSMVPTIPKLAGQNEKYLLKQMQDIRGNKDQGEEPERMVVEMTGLLDAMSDADLADIAAYYGSKQGSIGAVDPALVELGQTLYRAGNADKAVPACTACHSPTGAGNAQAGFPALSGQHAAYVDKQLHAYRNELRTNDSASVMRDVAALLSDKEIAAVASYIQGLSH